MKIKGKLIIPLVAILIAMFTIGITPGAAADTTAGDSLTYVPPTAAPTSSLEEKAEEAVSNLLGDTLQDAEEPLRGISEIMASFLNSIKSVLNRFIELLQGAGDMMGSGDLLGNLGGGFLS